MRQRKKVAAGELWRSRFDAERNLILISGAVPGAEGGQVIVRPSVKAAAQLRRKRIAPAKK